MLRKFYYSMAGVMAASLLAACGASTSSSGSAGPTTTASASRSSASDEAGVAEAKQLVAELTKTPTSVGLTVPISKPIPTGKRIVFMACGAPICTVYGNVAKQAAELLGWKLDIVSAGKTPEEVHAAWQRVARTPPDGVIAVGYPRTIFNDSLKLLQAAGVPVVEQGVTDPVGDGILHTIAGPTDQEPVGKAMAAWVVADTNGKANALYIDDKDYPILGPIQDYYATELRRLCGTCTTSSFQALTSDIGTKLPAQIVSKLRTNPEINYIVLGIDAMATGLPTALTNAGLSDKVKILGRTSAPVNKGYVKAGQQAADVAFPVYEGFYRLVDVLARHFAGESAGMEPVQLPTYIFTKENVGSTEASPIVTDYLAQYKRLWGKS